MVPRGNIAQTVFKPIAYILFHSHRTQPETKKFPDRCGSVGAGASHAAAEYQFSRIDASFILDETWSDGETLIPEPAKRAAKHGFQPLPQGERWA